MDLRHLLTQRYYGRAVKESERSTSTVSKKGLMVDMYAGCVMLVMFISSSAISLIVGLFLTANEKIANRVAGPRVV